MTTSELATKARDQLGGELRNVVEALAERAVGALTDRVNGAAERLTQYAEGGGGPGLAAAVTGAKKLAEGDSPMKSMMKAGLAGGKEKIKSAFGGGNDGGGGGGGGGAGKVTNIIETIEVGVPVRVAYNQWTTFGDFPSFMKKVESVDQEAEEKLNWKAQIFWSHRSWESTIIRQIPDRLIHWRSKGQKGSVDGTVTFHEVGPELTKILVVLEYHPQGLFEQTGNLWRAQGRRVRLEMKHFVRHVMTTTVLDPDSVEGWRGEIEDSQVVKDHETAMREESEDQDDSGEDRSGRRAPGDQDDEYADEDDHSEEDEGEDEDQDESENEDETEDESQDEDEQEPAEEEEQPRSRRRPAPPARRRQSAEDESRREPERSRPARRGSESPKRPVVRRRQEDRER